MKKIILTFICCFMFLLYIPFNTAALEYDDLLENLPDITSTQLSKIHELYNEKDSYSNFIIYYYNTNLYWSYDILSYNESNNLIIIKNRFALDSTGSINSLASETRISLFGSNNILYFSYNNNVIFNNQHLTITNDDILLFSTTYDNIVRTRTTSAAASNRVRYTSIVDYDITHIIKGTNFDVYFLVNGTYKLIQKSVNSFTLINHDSKIKFKDSSISNDYPDYPSVPSDTVESYENQFTHGSYLFKISELNSNNLIVTAPDTDNLLSNGNSNSQSSTNNNNQSNQLLNNTINNMDQLENNYKSDLNNNLNNINANDFNINGITQLSNAANFVRVQFDNLTKNNPFGIILGFSLFLGLSLLIFGKRL